MDLEVARLAVISIGIGVPSSPIREVFNFSSSPDIVPSYFDTISPFCSLALHFESDVVAIDLAVGDFALHRGSAAAGGRHVPVSFAPSAFRLKVVWRGVPPFRPGFSAVHLPVIRPRLRQMPRQAT